MNETKSDVIFYKNAKFIDTIIEGKTITLCEIEKDNGSTFRFWTNAEVVFDYVWHFLLKNFPSEILLPEVDRVDIMNLSQSIPIEIQSTIIKRSKVTSRIFLQHSIFYSHAKNQIEMNIAKYGKCWFFFDWDYFNFIMDGLGKDSIFNFSKLFRQDENDLVKVFLVRFDGVIRELKSSDFPLPITDDDFILANNKIKILHDILKQYKFTSNEIKEYRDMYFIETHSSDRFRSWLLSKRDNDRAILFGHILETQKRFTDINLLLDRKKKDHNNWLSYTSFAARTLGIIFYDQKVKKYTFSNQFSICKYFPAFQRNKDFWLSLIGKNFNKRQFNDIVFKKELIRLEDFNNSSKSN